ncbi:VOC family protein [Paractinoplanes rishiriensis]|uniref:Lactoylglutathione lyase n=1 Tax=Paractinoplanes rishiriensis TaxID=1050105 RepID=A0A919JY63_9ACTN|nr:VOC family protein [Actinoplanes rishiriensis]GIE95389.1 putative lactoylglutathione lyase [Actinoplanes rishiriensis]
MRMLHLGLRVTDLDRSLAFYRAVGYQVLGTVPDTPFGSLTMLKLPGDPFVSLELVHRPGREIDISAINHLVIQVDAMAGATAALTAAGLEVEDVNVHDADTGFSTAWLTDPDGYRIELVQWPAGHPAGMTEADFKPE